MRLASSSATEALVPPPAQEIEVLHHLALVGNMRSVKQHADHIAALDEAYRPFAQHLHALADRFQSAAILALVRRFRDNRQPELSP